MSKEIKVALLGIVALAALILGFNFLKGSNLLSPSRTYYATYPDVSGLNAGAPVILNGIKVGQVKNLDLQPAQGNMVRVALEMNKDIVLGDSTMASLGGSLLGSKTITLTLGRNSKTFSGGEELRTESDKGIAGLATALQARALPVLSSLDSTLRHVNGIVNKDAETNIQGTLRSARNSTEALQRLIESNQRNINQITTNMATLTRELVTTSQKFDRISANLTQLTDSLSRAPVGPMVRKLNATATEAQAAMASLNRTMTSTTGSLGKLINDDSLYTNLNATAASSNALITDFKANPKRYVHFSVFGGGGSKDKKTKSKTETTTKPNGTVEKEVKTVTVPTTSADSLASPKQQ